MCGTQIDLTNIIRSKKDNTVLRPPPMRRRVLIVVLSYELVFIFRIYKSTQPKKGINWAIKGRIRVYFEKGKIDGAQRGTV